MASAAVVSGSAGTSGSVGNRRMYGIKSLSWKALWNLREIRGGRLSEKVRGSIFGFDNEGSRRFVGQWVFGPELVAWMFCRADDPRSPT